MVTKALVGAGDYAETDGLTLDAVGGEDLGSGVAAFEVCDFPGEVVCVLDASVTAETVEGWVSVNCVAETVDLLGCGGVVFCYDFVDGPFGYAEQTDGDCVIAEKLTDTDHVFFFGWFWVDFGVPPLFGEDYKHPFRPSFDHAEDTHMTPFWVGAIGLNDPMEVADSSSDQVGEVGLNKDVKGNSTARFFDEWEIELSDNL